MVSVPRVTSDVVKQVSVNKKAYLYDNIIQLLIYWNELYLLKEENLAGI